GRNWGLQPLSTAGPQAPLFRFPAYVEPCPPPQSIVNPTKLTARVKEAWYANGATQRRVDAANDRRCIERQQRRRTPRVRRRRRVEARRTRLAHRVLLKRSMSPGGPAVGAQRPAQPSVARAPHCRSTPAVRHSSSRSAPSCASAARRSAVWRPPTVADWVSRTLISGPFGQHVGTFGKTHRGVTARRCRHVTPSTGG